jgi:uncharacterized protein YbaR (Trm112 family)/SAM-dependent methyltransferase
VRYALLDYLACPVCHDELACIGTEETPSVMPAEVFPVGRRVSRGPGVGPAPAWPRGGRLASLLTAAATPAASPERGREVEVASGLLVCGTCGRWFPIERTIPELLPDHLRDALRERPLFEAAVRGLPSDLRQALEAFQPSGDAQADPGAHYKRSEIGIKSKVDDPAFFGPGFSSPFNPWNSSFTTYLISLFGTVVPFLELERGGVVIDSGCGYSWSTEWLFRSGYDAIGVDICRTYLEIAVQRIGTFRPHLVVGDVENLPFRDDIANAILAYESFHHIPDRQKALAGYYRVMRSLGRAILAEPGAAHETAEVAVDAMAKYGILEKGMDLADVVGYAAGTGFDPPEQVFVFSTSSSDRPSRVDDEFARRHSTLHSNVYRLSKGVQEARRLARERERALQPRRSPIDRALGRARAALRLGPS